jgi:serine/threonine protein kinase
VIGEYLGKGAYGTVFKGTFKGEVVAVKILNPDKNFDKVKQEVEHEGAVLTTLQEFPCPNMMQIKAAFVCLENEVGVAQQTVGTSNNGGKYIVMVTSLVNGKDFEDVWKDMDCKARYSAMLDYANALTCLREHSYVHGDIKVENVMVETTGKGIIIDFGTAKTFVEAKALCLTAGFKTTEKYFPDDILSKDEAKCGLAIDHWDEFALAETILRTGASKEGDSEPGAKITELCKTMKTKSASPDSRWPAFISGLTEGKEKCGEDDGWKLTTPPPCPDTMDHATIARDPIYPFSIAKLTCEAGYAPVVPTTIHCRKSATSHWDRSCKGCQVLDIKNADVEMSNGVLVGSTAHINCHEGFHRSGEQVLTCEERARSAKWNHDIPTCKGCRDPEVNGVEVTEWRDNDEGEWFDGNECEWHVGNEIEWECASDNYDQMTDSPSKCVESQVPYPNDTPVWDPNPECKPIPKKKPVFALNVKKIQ